MIKIVAILILCFVVTNCSSIQSYRMYQIEEQTEESIRKMDQVIDNSFEKGK